jgi:hypothetical protein
MFVLDFCKMAIHSPLSRKERKTTRVALIAICKSPVRRSLACLCPSWLPCATSNAPQLKQNLPIFTSPNCTLQKSSSTPHRPRKLAKVELRPYKSILFLREEGVCQSDPRRWVCCLSLVGRSKSGFFGGGGLASASNPGILSPAAKFPQYSYVNSQPTFCVQRVERDGRAAASLLRFDPCVVQ